MIKKDRYAWFKFFFDNFYNVDKLRRHPHQRRSLERQLPGGGGLVRLRHIGLRADWLTDFRADLPKIDVPLLVVQGTEDRILPIDATGRRLPGLVKDIQFIEVEGGPHNIGWTHPDEVNDALMKFIG